MKVFNVCFTGISGSGKTTLSRKLSEKLKKENIKVQIIDGDETRSIIGNLFGHTKEERMKMNRVNRLLIKYLNNNGINTIAALVNPFEEMRNIMREDLGDTYIEVYAKCSYEKCAERDVKGYYKKVKNGTMKNLNGATDIFEEPTCPEIVVDTENDSIEKCTDIIFDYLINHGYIE